jgi:hypothetical protein
VEALLRQDGEPGALSVLEKGLVALVPAPVVQETGHLGGIAIELVKFRELACR